jgi:3-oxoacyl-[acyl-carrier protein] reductase
MRAFVTGGTSNLGKAICIELKKNGFEVFASFANNEIKAQEIGGEYGITFYHVDVCDEKEVKEVFSILPPLDLLVNNSGVCSVEKQESLSLKGFNSVLQINTTGVFLCCKYAIPKIVKGGSIINITSVNAINPISMGTSHYDGTKGFVNSYTRSLALELGERRIRVNAVAPGLLHANNESERKNSVRDKFVNRAVLKRTVDPKEIADTILFLSSNKAITGEIINVDCGFLIG